MENKSPAFQFYVADYLADANVQMMSLEEEGAYIRLICFCWREGSIPNDTEKLQKLIGKNCPFEVARVVQGWFTPHPNQPSKLVHLRLEEEREKQREWREKSSKGGIKSAETRREKAINRIKSEGNKLKGGSKMVDTKCEPNVNTTSTSTSTSTSTNTEDTHVSSVTPPVKKTLAPKIIMDEKGFRSLLEEFGNESYKYYLPICSDYLVSSGKAKKDGAAFMRNWIRKDIAERKGFYYLKLNPTLQNQNSINPHMSKALQNQIATKTAGEIFLQRTKDIEHEQQENQKQIEQGAYKDDIGATLLALSAPIRKS